MRKHHRVDAGNRSFEPSAATGALTLVKIKAVACCPGMRSGTIEIEVYAIIEIAFADHSFAFNALHASGRFAVSCKLDDWEPRTATVTARINA